MVLTAKKIDNVVDSLYAGTTGGGELKQLARLFSPSFSTNLEALLKAEFKTNNSFYNREITVELSYIDKIPVASFNPPITDIHGQSITERTEIGDAALFFIDKKYGNGQWFSVEARGLIFQAKQASSANLPKHVPIVPLPTNQNNSTLKELALLSAWPTFDLAFTGGSGDFIQEGYSIVYQNGTVPPHGWYIGASPKTNNPWSPRWIAGPSNSGAPCDQTLGSLLFAVIEDRGEINGIPRVGAKFAYDETRLTSANNVLTTVANPPNWNDLCHQIMLAANKYDAPTSIFGGAGKSRTAGLATLHAGPMAAIYELLQNIFEWLFKPKRRFPVLVVTRTSGEGKIPSHAAVAR